MISVTLTDDELQVLVDALDTELDRSQAYTQEVKHEPEVESALDWDVRVSALLSRIDRIRLLASELDKLTTKGMTP